MLWLKASWRQRECESDFLFQLHFRNPDCKARLYFGRWVWLPWLGMGLCACYCWKMGRDTQDLQNLTSSCSREEEKTAMHIIDKRHYTRAINSESFPPLCCLNHCCGGVREGEWLQCCVFVHKSQVSQGKYGESSHKCWFNKTSNTAIIIFC